MILRFNKLKQKGTSLSFMKKVSHPLILVLSLFIVMNAGGCSDSSPSGTNNPPGLLLVDIFENGKLYRTTGEGGSGQFNVLVLKGSWREMGRQYGYLLRNEMNEFYETVVTDYLIGTNGISYEDIGEAGDIFYAQQFSYVHELIAGMAETSGYSLEKMIIISSLVHLVDLASGCSSLSAWGDYTSDGPLVVGRNWDIGDPYGEYKKFLSVVIYNPAGSSISVADINFVGTISLQTGMNSSGIFLDLQNGTLSDKAEVPDRKLPTYMLFDFLLNSSTLEELDLRLLDLANLPQIALIINVADLSEDRVYEWATYDVKRRTGNGLIASTNYFIDPAWTDLPVVPYGAEGDYSIERLANLLALGEQFKGTINAEKMMQIFDTTFSDGGPTFPEYTVYQVVVVPVEQTIWLKARDYSGWERIELKPLFDASP
jgi:hypothetical protein